MKDEADRLMYQTRNSRVRMRLASGSSRRASTQFQAILILSMVVIAGLGVYLLSATPPLHTSRLPDPDEVKALLVQLVDVEKRAPGIVVGMISDNPREQWVVGYGRLSVTDKRVPNGDTVFEIGSITKGFTGILLAKAVLDGEVKLEDPISKYLPEGVTAPEYEGKSITLLDLATHYSGLPRMPSNFNPKDSSNPYADYTMSQMYDFLSGYQLTRAPGSTYEYSNYAMGLLGNLLVHRAGEVDYEYLLKDSITSPLGLDSTSTMLTSEMRLRMATPHSSYSVPTSNLDTPTLSGAGAIHSTANDMLKFLAANIGLTETELLPAIQLANTPQRPGSSLTYIGLGWNLPKSGNGIHSHGGATFGYTSFMAWDSERKIGVVVLMNVYSGPSESIGYTLMRGLLKPYPVDPQVLAAYVGRYRVNGTDFVIRVDGAHIFLQILGVQDYELVAISENQFFLSATGGEITFNRNGVGVVDRGIYVESGITLEAKRVP